MVFLKKEVMQISRQTMMLLVLLVVVAAGVYYFYGRTLSEAFASAILRKDSSLSLREGDHQANEEGAGRMTDMPVEKSKFVNLESDPSMESARIALAPGCMGPDALSVATNLLPKGPSSIEDQEWSEYVPKNLDTNFVPHTSLGGLNTVGATRKNSNLDLRPAPPNPRGVLTGVFMSTYPGNAPRRPIFDCE